MFVVEAADLKAITPGNSLCKYADDAYNPSQQLTPEPLSSNILVHEG